MTFTPDKTKIVNQEKLYLSYCPHLMVVIVKEVWVFNDNIGWVFNGEGAQIDYRLLVELVGVLEKS